MADVIKVPPGDYITVTRSDSGDIFVPRDLAYAEFYRARRAMHENAADWFERLLISHLIKQVGYDACIEAAAEEIARHR